MILSPSKDSCVYLIFALLQTSSRLFHIVQFVKCWQILVELNSKGLSAKLRKRKTLSCVYVLYKTWNYSISRPSLTATAEKCTKKRDARTKLLFCRSKPVAFLPFSLPSPSLLLNLPTANPSLWFKVKTCGNNCISLFGIQKELVQVSVKRAFPWARFSEAVPKPDLQIITYGFSLPGQS